MDRIKLSNNLMVDLQLLRVKLTVMKDQANSYIKIVKNGKQIPRVKLTVTNGEANSY